ncbi:P-loop containing nucleoside triphosphate hydrolase protein [Globomyces pollinis-pini]|nr:P-loop containing nucleoside triphosphate hydrolase protein [Globomyces pollinis-pini]
MGPSGSGKSTCLDILANKEKKGVVMGSIKLNGKKIDNAFPFQNIAGYVDQEDIHLSCLTVREILEFSAQLRLPESMSVQQKSERVQLVLTQLGLAHVADSRIGNTLDRGISGGEKRRLSIGIELVTNPSILFLDEPTSGLDSYNALQVIQTLSNLAKESKKTIIFTIHQPNSTIFSLFDKLLLLSDGIPIYFGSSTSVEEFCVSKGSPCPPKTHIADHVLNYACEKGRTEMSPKEAITPSGRKNSMLVGQTDENGILDDHSIRFSYASSLTQLQKVLGRSWKTLYRNPLIFISHVIISVSLGLFIGFLYLKVDSSLAGIQNRLGSIFFLQSLIAFSGLSAISSLQADLVLFVRERSNGFYGFFPYFVSKVLFDLIPLRVLPSTIMCSIAYYLIGYSIDQTTFFKFLGIMVIFSANSGLFCLMIGCLIRDNATAILVASITTLFQMLFAGILINQVQIPITLRWIQYLSFFKYAYEACVVNDAAGLKLVDTISGFDVTFPAAVVLEKFGLDVSAYWKDLAVSVGLFLTLLILISLTIKLKLKQNK